MSCTALHEHWGKINDFLKISKFSGFQVLKGLPFEETLRANKLLAKTLFLLSRNSNTS